MRRVNAHPVQYCSQIKAAHAGRRNKERRQFVDPSSIETYGSPIEKGGESVLVQQYALAKLLWVRPHPQIFWNAVLITYFFYF
jgi:hypothetical protein